MNFKRTILDNCTVEAVGLVVVIDVLRAFTTAAFALAGGAEKLILVSEVDEALADYLELRGERPNPAPFLQKAHESDSGRLFADPARPDYPIIDLDYATALDRFGFALRVTRENGLHILQKHI